jgi:hypothetical protein
MRFMSIWNPKGRSRSRRRIAFAGVSATLVTSFLAASPALSGVAGSVTTLPPVRHVFVIVLENESFASTFGNPSPPASQLFLDRTLPGLGALLPNYYGTGHQSNDNYRWSVASPRTP